MSRSLRTFAAALATFAIFFAQLSVAAYACPAASSQQVASAPACEEMDAAQPNLCEKHCHDEQQVGSGWQAPIGFTASFVATVAQAQPVVARPRTPVGLHYATSPPQAVCHCRWRI